MAAAGGDARAHLQGVIGKVATGAKLKNQISAIAAPQAKGDPNNIKVGVRCRPLSTSEKEKNEETITQFSGTDICLTNPSPNQGEPAEQIFAYDFLYAPDSSSESVFVDMAQPLVEGLFEGYNGTIFAYGQTGTGKTHSIYGPVDASHEHRGLALRAIEALFRHLGGLEASIGGTKRVAGITDVPPVVRASYVELYNDAFNDLLTPADVVLAEPTAGMDLRLRTAPSGAYVEGLTEVEVATPAEIFELVAAGNAIVQRYNDPLTLPWRRRNEIHVPIDGASCATAAAAAQSGGHDAADS